jgi:hypothetical protein
MVMLNNQMVYHGKLILVSHGWFMVVVSADLRRYVSKEKNPGEDGEESWRSLDGSPWVSVKCPTSLAEYGLHSLEIGYPKIIKKWL